MRKGADWHQFKSIGSGPCPPTHIFLTAFFVPAMMHRKLIHLKFPVAKKKKKKELNVWWRCSLISMQVCDEQTYFLKALLIPLEMQSDETIIGASISLHPTWLFPFMWISDPVWTCSAGTNFLKKILTSQLSTGRLQARLDVTSLSPHCVKLVQKPKTYKLCRVSVWQM